MIVLDLRGEFVNVWNAIPVGMALIAFTINSACASDASEKKAAELEWAKGVAGDFLAAAFRGDLEQAESLIDSSLKKTFAMQGETRLQEWLNNSIAIQHFRNPVFESEAIAPDQDEASFTGTFQEDAAIYEFSLRVIKDKEGGKWRVSFFRFHRRDEK